MSLPSNQDAAVTGEINNLGKRTASFADLDNEQAAKRPFADPAQMDSSMAKLKSDSDNSLWQDLNLEAINMKRLYQYIKQSGPLDIHDKDGYGILYLAAKNQSLEALRILVLQPAIQVNVLNGPHNETPLHAAAQGDNSDAVELLLENDALVDIPDDLGHTPLYDSIFSKSVDSMKLLLKAGARCDHVDNQGNSLLHIAVSQDFVEGIDLLVEHGCDVNVTNIAGISPLANAIQMNYPQVMKKLLSHGANPNSRAKYQRSMLHHAVTWNRIDAVEALLEVGCEINVVNAMDETPLLVAVQQRKIDIVERLVAAGADPHIGAGGVWQSTNLPLLYSANHGYGEMCNMLVTDKTSDFLIKFAAELGQRSQNSPHTTQVLANKLKARKEAAKVEVKKENRDNTESGSHHSELELDKQPTDLDFDALINAAEDAASEHSKNGSQRNITQDIQSMTTESDDLQSRSLDIMDGDFANVFGDNS
jgi:ankyrin repeat protein